jgi:hypothetical protein
VQKIEKFASLPNNFFLGLILGHTLDTSFFLMFALLRRQLTLDWLGYLANVPSNPTKLYKKL